MDRLTAAMAGGEIGYENMTNIIHSPFQHNLKAPIPVLSRDLTI